MKIVLQKKYDNEPDFVIGRFSLEVIDGLSIGDFRVMRKKDGDFYLKIGIWVKDANEEKTNVFVKAETQQKLIKAYVKAIIEEGYDPEEFKGIIEAYSTAEVEA